MTTPKTPKPAPSRRPQPKVAAAGVGGAAVTVAVAIAAALGADISPELAAALSTLAAFAAGYLLPQA